MSQDYKITVDIFCEWQSDPRSYRIYIDDELLTERTYIWRNPDQYIRENIIVKLSPGTHRFKIESVEKNISEAENFRSFYYGGFKINNNPINLKNGEFTI